MTVTEQILAGIPKIAALVVGDICLDRWCMYDPDLAEPSRETRIPRIGVVATDLTPGAGGTVANNLVALDASRVSVLGVVGDDGHGSELMRALEERHISTELMVRTTAVPTFTYTKLINARTRQEDLPRVDFLPTQPLPDEVERKLLNRLESVAGGYDVVLIEDQSETEQGGVITNSVRQALCDLSLRSRGRKVFWADSRKRPDQFRHVIVKPNAEEADESSRRLFGAVDYERLREHMDAPFLVITRGPEGAVLVQPERTQRVPAQKIDKPVDICGAGDSFSAGAALALAVTGSPLKAVRFGNAVAAITIMKRGTGTAAPLEILAAEARR